MLMGQLNTKVLYIAKLSRHVSQVAGPYCAISFAIETYLTMLSVPPKMTEIAIWKTRQIHLSIGVLVIFGYELPLISAECD